MIRLLTAAAFAVLLASPVMAQSVSPGERSEPPLQNQGTSTVPSTPPSAQEPGLSGQLPADCAPNDPRPACQTAQLPGQEPSGTAITPSTPPAEREGSSTLGGPSANPESSGSSGSMER